MGLLRKKSPPKPTYAFSESVSAVTSSPWHISAVPGGELKLGGGAPAPLCARPWMNGWHLKAGLVAETLQLDPSWVDREFVCRPCAAAWREIHHG